MTGGQEHEISQTSEDFPLPPFGGQKPRDCAEKEGGVREVVIAVLFVAAFFIGIPAVVAILFKPILEYAYMSNERANREAWENGEV